MASKWPAELKVGDVFIRPETEAESHGPPTPKAGRARFRIVEITNLDTFPKAALERLSDGKRVTATFAPWAMVEVETEGAA